MVDWSLLGILLTTRGATAVALLALSGWVIWLNPRDSLHRALALVLFVIAMERGLFLLGGQPVLLGDFIARVLTYFLLAIPFAALWFAAAYARRYHAPGTRVRRMASHPATGYGILAAAAVVLILYAWDHSLFVRGGTPGFAPLEFHPALTDLAYAGVALLLARGVDTTERDVCRRALTLSAIGFAMPVFVSSTFQTAVAAIALTGHTWPGRLDVVGEPVVQVRTVLYVVSIAMAVWALAILWRRGRAAGPGSPPRRWSVRATGAAAAGTVLAVVFAGLFVTVEDRLAVAYAYALVVGLWFLALPALTGLAILRHDLFDIDVKVKHGLRRATIVGLLVAVFFTVSETAEFVVETGTGSTALGLAAAGGLVLALRPLERMAGRFADAAMPDAKTPDQMTRSERVELFREQVELAWLDGVLRTKERMLLERLRDRLGIDTEDAARMESEAASGHTDRRRGQRAAPA